MAEMNKLIGIWADKLLDTGKRNNLINFKDSKASSAELIYPSAQEIFSACSVGETFDVFDPKIRDEDDDSASDEAEDQKEEKKHLSREQFIEKYTGYIRKENQILIYAQTPNPMTAVKNIAKKAKQILDETGSSVSYLAFGFIRWKESKDPFHLFPRLH